jgi:hypothetical protein
MGSQNLEDQFKPSAGMSGKKFTIMMYVGFLVFCAICGFGTFYGGILISGKKINTHIDREKVRSKLEEQGHEQPGIFPGAR